MQRDIYLQNRPWEEILRAMFADMDSRCRPSNEIIDVRQALGRISGAAIQARRSSPHYPAAAMDGFAVRACDTYGVSERQLRRLNSQAAIRVDTGDPMPAGFDAVIMIEEVIDQGEDFIVIGNPVAPGENVRPVGEDMVAGEVLLPINHRIRAQDQGALLTAGVITIPVRRKPRVGILPTGDEVRSSGAELGIGDIADSNSPMLASLVAEWGGVATVWPIAPDRPDSLEKSVLEMAATQDIIVLIAGSSQGRDDYTARTVEKFGRLYAHGVAIKPGKPVILGEIQDKPVIGIPGYPVSAFLTAGLFLQPWVAYLQGITPSVVPAIQAVLSRKVFSNLGPEEFVRVKIGRVDERWIATPLSRGAGVTMSLVRADGILRVPRLQEGFHEGETVPVELLRPQSELAETIVCIGSHDLTLDVLASRLKEQTGNGGLASAHVGSMAGILALRRRETHLSGIHLLDPESGQYNYAYLKRFLPGREIVLINLVYRTQGLLVRPGNPLGLHGLADLIRSGVKYVNRQGGSGTRVLLDYLLGQQDIDREQIAGYEHEEFTHLGVAVAIASGAADAGLGIQSAACSFGLDFIPVGEERYDLAVPVEYMTDPRIETLLAIIRNPEFQAEITAMGGYDTRDTGRIMSE